MSNNNHHHHHHGTTTKTTTSNNSSYYLSTTTTTMVVAASDTKTFDPNLPRPPALGEEQGPVKTCASPGPASWEQRQFSPSHTPKRLYQEALSHFKHPSDVGHFYGPEGSDRATPSSFIELGTPPYLRWAKSLDCLLEDPDGVELFKKFLKLNGSTDMLDFWFACEGLKNSDRDEDQVAQLVRLIHKKYFKSVSTLRVSDLIKKEVYRKVKEVSKRELKPDRNVFDDAQNEVETFISLTSYPEFLQSDTYLQHLQLMQRGGFSRAGCLAVAGSEEETSSSSSSNGKELAACSELLPTLHEDSELDVTHHSHHHHHHKHVASNPNEPLPLTKDMLIKTQRKRASDFRPKSEIFSRLRQQISTTTCIQSPLPNPYHITTSLHHRSGSGITYSQYNPVSRQDSELQSLSSDAHTEDSASVTNSSLDGSVYRPVRIGHHIPGRQIREQMRSNRDSHLSQTIIPRTQRVPKEKFQTLPPELFATQLIQKLEKVIRDREIQDKLEQKTQESECGGEEMSATATNETGNPRVIAEAIIGLQTAKTPKQFAADDQSILDQHVQRVWSDLTPSRSPGVVSPRPHSPEGRRRTAVPNFLPVLPESSQSYRGVRPRRDKDGVSIISSDSGNVQDYSDLPLTKSKSMYDYPDLQNIGVSVKEPVRRATSSSRKTLTEFTDSGVSVISDTPPCVLKETSKVLMWLSASSDTSSSKHKTRSTGSSSNTTRQARASKKGTGSGGSRSGSAERGASSTRSHSLVQPFIADPKMPLLPSPHTPTQLEEARRRLEEVKFSSKSSNSSKQRPSKSHSGHYDIDNTLPPPPSLQPQSIHYNTLGRLSTMSSSTATTAPLPPPPTTQPTPVTTYTTVTFSFCDEDVPYRSKIQGNTLKHFKEILPKKGNYRYFFKTACEEVDTKVIHEEVMDDNEILPLWEGKVVAQVKPIE